MILLSLKQMRILTHPYRARNNKGTYCAIQYPLRDNMKKQSPTKMPTTGSPVPDLSLSRPDPIQLDTPTQLIAPEHLEALSAHKERPEVLCEMFTQQLTLGSDPKIDLRTKVERDFLLFAYFWATKQGMETENISIYLGLIHGLYQSISLPGASKEKLILELEQRMKGGGLEGYTGGLSGFTETELRNIMEFVSISLLQHFELYRFVLTQERATKEFNQEIEIEKLPETSTLQIAPLEESVPVSFFNTLISPQPISAQKKPDTTEAYETAQLISSEVEAIKEKFSHDQVTKVVSLTTERIVSNFKNELYERLNAKETEFQARIKKIENKLEK